MRPSFLDPPKNYKTELQILANEYEQYRFNSTMITIALSIATLAEAIGIIYLLYA